MKNQLIIVYGAKTEEDRDGYITYKEHTEPIAFKNKDKANLYKETIIDEFMKTKSYSHNYTIDEEYQVRDSVIKTYHTDILNKYEECVYRVVIMIIDLTNMVM